jgi:Phosphate-selective porin O and P
MINRLSRIFLQCLMLALCCVALRAHAEPYLAVQMGLKCGQCHVNPTGGGLRTTYGDVFAQTLMPHDHIDTGNDVWTGEINRFLRVGGDLRFDATVTTQPHTRNVDTFAFDSTRLYIEANVIPERLLVYVDEQVAPGGALNREAYGVYWSKNHDWYLKGGQMYLPFGWRLQDQSALIQTASGINMTTPDQGVEFGWERGHWDAQLAVTNGTGGSSSSSGDNGKQYSGQLIWVESMWRVGGAANWNNKNVGNRSAFALFAGLRTGPIEWLAQGELIDDKSVAQGTTLKGQRQAAGLVEGNWAITRGNNLKITGEYYDPDRSVANNAQTRWSVVYEWTPIQFVQLRGGTRISDGIPQINSQHTRLYFVELHGFF